MVEQEMYYWGYPAQMQEKLEYSTLCDSLPPDKIDVAGTGREALNVGISMLDSSH